MFNNFLNKLFFVLKMSQEEYETISEKQRNEMIMLKIHNEIMALKIQLSHGNQKIETLTTNTTPIVILISIQNYTISSTSQPIHDSVYIAIYECQNVTLPAAPAGGFSGTFKIIIKNINGSTVNIHMASASSNDVVTFSGTTYVNDNYFELTNRGFVELSWSSGGWFVINQFGLTAV